MEIENLNAEKLEKFCDFLVRHGFGDQIDPIRKAPIDEVKKPIGILLDSIEFGALRFSPY